MASKTKPGPCSLCGRISALTFHHLIPRKVHRRNFFRKRIDPERLQQGVAVCRDCHNGIHRLHDEMTLAKQLNTLEALRDDPALRRHVQWVSRQRRSMPGN